MATTTPYTATHPGIILKNEIDSREIKQKDFAHNLGMSSSILNEIIKGKRSITADFAVILEAALGIPADFWTRFQSQYDIDLARVKEKNAIKIELIKELSSLQEYVPINFLTKLGYLPIDLKGQINKIKEIYQASSIQDIVEMVASQPKLAFYRKSSKLQIIDSNVLAWSKLAEYEASKMTTCEFKKGDINNLKADLQIIFYENKNVREKTKAKLEQYGIKLIFIEKVEKAPIDGFSFWSNNNPAIALTLRHKRIDNFAFTIFHELGHIELHLQEGKKIQFLDLDKQSKDEYENEADNYAQLSLISKDRWNELLMKFTPLTDQNMRLFGEMHTVNPAIILGRACYEMKRYNIKSSIDNKLH